MKQSSYTIGAAQKDIRALSGDHYVNINMRVTKTTVSAKLVNGILEAGTILTSAGAVSTTGADAYGIVFVDVDFNNSKGTEVVPVMIHGFVNESKIKLDATNGAAQKTALRMIAFL